MKSLVLCLVLFLIGTHGVSIAQEKEPKPERPGVQESLKKVIRGGFIIGAELVGMIDSPDIEIENHLHKRVESLLIDAYNMFFAIGVTIVDTYNEVDKEIHEHYSTYRTEVIPIVVEHVHKAFEYVISLKEEILPYVKKTNVQMAQIQLQFITEMKTLFESHKDKLQSFREEMTAKIRPFVGQVQQEVKAAAKEESDQQQLTKEQREMYKDILKGVVSYREEDTSKLLELLEKVKNKA